MSCATGTIAINNSFFSPTRKILNEFSAWSVLVKLTTTQVQGVNAWYKAFKFAFSTFLFTWAMGWYCYYLLDFNIKPFNWDIIILLGFEVFYIAFQAGKGQLSHFNVSTPLY